MHGSSTLGTLRPACKALAFNRPKLFYFFADKLQLNYFALAWPMSFISSGLTESASNYRDFGIFAGIKVSEAIFKYLHPWQSHPTVKDRPGLLLHRQQSGAALVFVFAGHDNITCPATSIFYKYTCTLAGYLFHPDPNETGSLQRSR